MMGTDTSVTTRKAGLWQRFNEWLERCAVEAEAEAEKKKQERARQLVIEQQQAIELKVYADRCALEAKWRRVAMDAAREEAVIFVTNLGYGLSWVGWFPRYTEGWLLPKSLSEKEVQDQYEQRYRYHSQLVETYTAQILARNDNAQYAQMQQQNAWGDANYAQDASAINSQLRGGAGSLRFED